MSDVDAVSCAVPLPVGDAPPSAIDGAASPGRSPQSPGAQARFDILRSARSIAIVGASDNPARASYFVGSYLLGSSPYEVHFVNPRAATILGRPVYASLADLPEPPDIVDVFRRHDDLPGVAQEAVDVGAKVLWLQLGSRSEDAARIAEDAGLQVVMDRCVKVEHARFHGGLHLAGFDTGVISSKRQVLSRPSAR